MHASLGWRIILCIARFKALRPKQRVLQFENMETQQKFYTITCSTRQRLIEQIFTRGILPLRVNLYRLLVAAEICENPLGIRNRVNMKGERIPSSWNYIYIRFLELPTYSEDNKFFENFSKLRL